MVSTTPEDLLRRRLSGGSVVREGTPQTRGFRTFGPERGRPRVSECWCPRDRPSGSSVCGVTGKRGCRDSLGRRFLLTYYVDEARDGLGLE